MFIYVFEDGSVFTSHRSPGQGDVEAIDCGALTVLKVTVNGGTPRVSALLPHEGDLSKLDEQPLCETLWDEEHQCNIPA